MSTADRIESDDDRIAFEFDDGGQLAFKVKAGACAVRAIAIATGTPYPTVYKDLKQRAKDGKMPQLAQLSDLGHRAYLKELGWEWVSLKGAKVQLRAAELPAGAVIASVRGALVAVVDHVARDYSCACLDQVVSGYFRKSRKPAGVEQLREIVVRKQAEVRGEATLQPVSSIAGLPVHPLLEVLAIDDQAVQRIAESIDERGQDVPIALWRGMLVDGRHRARACARLGIEPKTSDLPAEWDADHVEGYILDANFNRKEAPWRDRVAAYLRLRHGWPGEVVCGHNSKRADVARRVRLDDHTASQLDRLVAAATPGTKWGTRKTAHGGETVGVRAAGQELDEPLRESAAHSLSVPFESPQQVADHEKALVDQIADRIAVDDRKRNREQRAKEIQEAGAVDFQAKKDEQQELSAMLAEAVTDAAERSRGKQKVDPEERAARIVDGFALQFVCLLRQVRAHRDLELRHKEAVLQRVWKALSDTRDGVREDAS